MDVKFEHRNCCDEKVIPSIKDETMCVKARSLLNKLEEAEEKIDLINRTIFADETEESMGRCPDCLDTNIDFAIESAMCILRKLENIIGRL